MVAVRGKAAFLLLITIATLGCATAPQESKNLTFEYIFESPPTFDDFNPPGDWDGKIPFFDFDLYSSKPFSHSDVYAIILNQTEWDYLFTPYKKPPSPIEFKDKFVIAYGKIGLPYGARVRILNLTQSDGTINITVSNGVPLPVQVPATLYQSFTRSGLPYDIVAVKKSELLQKGDITFIFRDIRGAQFGNVTRFIS